MGMKRRWIASCDHGNCTVTLTLEPVDRRDAGRDLNDAGWQAAGPGIPVAFCERHWLPEDEWLALLEATAPN